MTIKMPPKDYFQWTESEKEDVSKQIQELLQKQKQFRIPENEEAEFILPDVTGWELQDIKQRYEEELTNEAVLITHLEMQNKEMLPHAEMGFRVKQGYEKSGGRPPAFEQNAIYQQMAEETWKKRPGLTKTAVAIDIEKTLVDAVKGKKRSKKDPKIPGWNTIRRLIKKPT